MCYLCIDIQKWLHVQFISDKHYIPQGLHLPCYMVSRGRWPTQLSQRAGHGVPGVVLWLPHVVLLHRVDSEHARNVHANHIGVPKQWNGGHVGVPNQSCGSWTLFLCKHFLLFQLICMATGHVSAYALFIRYSFIFMQIKLIFIRFCR